MAERSRSRNVTFLLIAVALGIGIIAWSTSEPKGGFVLGGAVALIILYLCFLRLTWGLAMLAMAMLLTPELSLSATSGAGVGMDASRAVALRLDDFIIAVVALGWAVSSAYRSEEYAVAWTPITRGVWVYMIATAAATILGMINGYVQLKSGFFFNLKYFEYFLMFLMVLAIVKTRQQAVRLVRVMLFVLVVVSIHGWSQIPRGGRVLAPFDTEPNTLSGYFLVASSMAVALGLYEEVKWVRWSYYGCAALSFLPFLFTRSRAGYLGLIFAYLGLLLYGKQRWRVLFVGFLVLALIAVGWVKLPEAVMERIRYTFSGQRQENVEQFRVGEVEFDPSSSARVVSYRNALKIWLQHPLFGMGVTGTTFIDGQYFRLLAETGLVGFGAFLYLLWRVFRATMDVHRNSPEGSIFKPLSLGMLCALFGLAAHGLTANTFVIIRIAEPFWFTLGLVMLGPRFDGWQPRFLRLYGQPTDEPLASPAAEATEPRPSPGPRRPRGPVAGESRSPPAGHSPGRPSGWPRGGPRASQPGAV